MKNQTKILASVLCLLLVTFCIVGLASCGEKECSHQWEEWSVTKEASCTEAGEQTRKCAKCGEPEASPIQALGHDWNDATCTAPKTCKTCSATEGTASAHAYTVEAVKAEALKSAANCESAAVYYKSCSCGAISTSAEDTFTSGTALEHVDANKDHACDSGCSKAIGEHADGDDNNHLCDYGCEKIADDGCYDTIVDGKCDECGADIDHTCVDADKNHACDICSAAMGEHSDANKDHNCDYGCTETIGEHADGDDNNHLCDYGCEKIADDGCYDTVVNGKCDECGVDIDHTCVDENKNHACDICSAAMGEHTDTNKDHNCDYGCKETIGTCGDADFDHVCDYGCDKALGACEDTNKDHECDHGCDKTFGEHSDSDADDDHVCDYGCGAIIESCSDVANDNDHNCDVCGNTDVTEHSYSDATCGAPATCSECGATTGTTLEHKDENHDHICDNGCNKNDIGDHADSATDDDQVCDYGCNAVLESCYDVETDNDHDCDVCKKENVTSHAHVENTALATAATCNTAATKTYECNCGDKYTEEDGDALGHNITGVKAEERAVSGCEYVLVYICQNENCDNKNKEVIGETVYHHDYVASISKAATCSADGEKTFKCSACGDTSKKAETIPADATGHDWKSLGEESGVRTDKCSVCGETKTVIVSDGNSASSNASNLADKDVQLKVDDNTNANIQLGQGVADAIGNKDITISAGVVDENTLVNMGVSEEQLGQIGKNTVYDFNIKDGNGTPVSDFGKENFVTITLPYKLEEGEDIDSIAVWFISDSCQVEECDKGKDCVDAHKLVSIEATYNNGFVTFQTNHFSIYTVTRLTPAERCELYGHGYAEQVVEGSCTKDGYVLLVCVRCHDKLIKEGTFVEADGHDYSTETHNATCTENGYVLNTCNDCGHSYRTKINATGHTWSEIDSGDASCTVDGFIKYGCDNCKDEYTVIYPRTGHKYTKTVVPATCVSDGYTIYDCDNCDYYYTDSYVEALGHSFEAGEWTWEANGNKATLTLVCEHDDTHTTALHVNSTMEKEVEKGACSNYVIRTHTARVEYNGVVYTDVKIIRQGNPTHNFSADWTSDDKEHWHECICGDKTDIAAHTFGEATTTKAPTCKDAGESTAYCTVCGEAKVTAIPATGEHTYVDGVCSGCGKEETSCDHTELHRESIDFGELGTCDFILYYDTCECGEVKIIDPNSTMNIPCDLDTNYEEDQYEDEDGNLVQTMKATCVHCGMEVSATLIRREDICTTTYEISYTFKLNGEVIIANVGMVEENTYHREHVRDALDLSEYGACGGTLTVSKCKECGALVNIDEIDADCGVDFESEPEEEKNEEAEGANKADNSSDNDNNGGDLPF